jgi:hypothetical protein
MNTGKIGVRATMCMLPGRYPESLKTIDSLAGQVDKIYLSLNGFWEVPRELKRDWIEVVHLGKNLGDASRFYLIRNTGRIDFDLISCDDDLIYPPNYVQDFLKFKAKYPGCLLSHHGNVASSGKNFKFYSAIKIRQKNKKELRLATPGSGASFIPMEVFNLMEFNSKVSLNQADIHLACNCHINQIPIIGLPHPDNYVEYFHPKDNYTIWDTVTNQPDWMEKVYEIYRSYGMNV